MAPFSGTGVRQRSLLIVAALLAGASAASAGVPDRVTGAVDPSQRHALAQGPHPLVATATDRGRSRRDDLIEGVSLSFAPSAAARAERDRLLVDQRRAGDPEFHRWLTPEAYGARFGIGEGDLARLSAWLASEGLRVERVARGRNALFLAGAPEHIEHAFATEIHDYELDGRIHRASAVAPSVPAAFGEVLLTLSGIDDLPLPGSSTATTRGPIDDPPPPEYYTAGLRHSLAPADLAIQYDLQRLYDLGIDGTGVSIAIVGQSFYYPSNIDKFRRLTGLPAARVKNVLVPGSGAASFLGASLNEAEGDIETAGAIAPGADVVYVYTGGAAGKSVSDALAYAIDQDLAPIVSVSYHFACEAYWMDYKATLDEQVAQANAQGMTIVVSSGDAGAAGCESNRDAIATHGLAVRLPSSLPGVTAVGGTELDDSGAGYWNATNDARLESLLMPVPEVAWNDSLHDTVFAAGGGGTSAIYDQPDWQAGDGTMSGGRDVPDLALTASWDHDAILYCTDTLCSKGANNPTSFSAFGGTSASAPTFAGMLALLLQRQLADDPGCPAERLGNVNPLLYSLATGHPEVFHDIQSGDNTVACQQGTRDCPQAAPFRLGFAAGRGFDRATGLGSIDGYHLWSATRHPTTATLAASPPAGGAGAVLTVTVAGTIACPVPTGKVTFSEGATQLGAATLVPVAGTNGAAATLSIMLPAGLHHVVASYPGDISFAPSVSAQVEVTVAAAGCGCRAVGSRSRGGTAPLLPILVLLAALARRRTRRGDQGVDGSAGPAAGPWAYRGQP